MAAKKYKRLTNREKQVRKEIRAGMIEKGYCPPPKPRMNRKKYIQETEDMWENRDRDQIYYIYFMPAIAYMLGQRDRNWKISQEAVGAAKILRLILRLAEFNQKLKQDGQATYKIDEQREFVKDILDA